MSAASKPVKVRVSMTVEVDPELWEQEYGIDKTDRAALRDDVRGYYLSVAQDAYPMTSGIVTVTEAK